jgi:2-enoate reductase
MKLFTPASIGNLSLKNRVVMLPMMSRLNDQNSDLSERALEFYAARAKGGAGLIIAAMWAASRDVDLVREADPEVFMADRPEYLNRLRQLADMVHEYGARIALQLTAGHGRVAWLRGLKGGAVAPSEQPCFYDPGTIARALTVAEIKRLVRGFGTNS